MGHDAYVVDAVRTPVGRLGGALATVRPDDLAAGTLRALIGRSPWLDPATIDEVYLGAANQAGEDNRNVARMAVLLAGLPTSIPGATMNRLCGSGLEAIIGASRALTVGDADVAVAGGVESMSRAPWILPKPERGFPTGHEQLWSSTLGWRMVNPAMPAAWTVTLGEGAEVLADEFSIGRDEQDEFALGSHQRAHEAWEAHAFDAEITSVDRQRPRPRREHPPGHHARTPGEAGAGVPPGRNGHRRQRVADERWRRHAAADVARWGRPNGRIATRPHRRCRDVGRGTPPVRHRAGRSSPNRAAAGGADVGRHRVGRAERSVRSAEHRLPALVAGPRPGQGQPARRRDRHRTPARRLRGADHDDARPPPAPHGWPLRGRGDVHRRGPGHRRRGRELS